MRKVVDANSLRDRSLEDYLRTSDENVAVLSDYSCMETYKGDSLKNLRKSLEIVSRYPTQVIVLRGTREIIGSGPLATSPEMLVDQEQTAEFPLFCFGVSWAARGHRGLLSQIRTKGRLANEHFHQVRADARRFAQAVLQIADSLGPAAVKELRKGETLKPETIDVIIRDILLVAASLFRDHPDAGEMPSAREVPRTFILRYALASYLLTLRWISDSGIQAAPPATLVNDLVDMTQVAYATFFDGILSRDRKLLEIHEQALFFLREVFVPPAEETTSDERAH